MNRSTAHLALIALLSLVVRANGAEPGLPQSWLEAWKAPAAECRPLQIVHGVPPKYASIEGMKHFKDQGLGGLVTNVHFDNYLQSEEKWKTLVSAVDACQKLGMIVWIYDEQGYPSGAAGGLVLKEMPHGQATALFYDKAAGEPFRTGPVFEFTHASNNVFACRRYINLLDERPVDLFIQKTHEAYWNHLKSYFGKTVVATFTDEPSLMAVYVFPSKARVQDPIDPKVKMTPCVPWGLGIVPKYYARYGKNLETERRSLFEGDSPEDRQVRQRFWSLVADLVADRYYGQIEQWCRGHGVRSSGHTLAEETLIYQVPLDGNALKVLMRMDIPGLDMLSSRPEFVLDSGWLTAALPYSAAILNGGRRVMTEVSDLSETMNGNGPANLEQMQATAAWQAAWGVTEFTLYYSAGDRPAGAHRAYCDYVGRLNAMLRDARPEPRVLLYYPINDLWAEYKPVAAPLSMATQSARAKQIVRSFGELGRGLQSAQIPFMLVDHEQLATALVMEGAITLAGRQFDTVLIPEGCELPAELEAVRKTGGRWIRHEEIKAHMTPEELATLVGAHYRLTPGSKQVVMGKFRRDGREVLMLVNVGRQAYQGTLAGATGSAWQAMNPADGKVETGKVERDGLRIELGAREAVILVN